MFVAHDAARSNQVARGALPAAPVTLDGLLAESRSNPYRVQVFLQAMAFGCTPEMLVMIWMSGLGCTVEKLTVDYERHDRSVLFIMLRLLDASSMIEFQSTELWDLAVLRFAGLAKTDEAPQVSGFDPMSLPVSSRSQST